MPYFVQITKGILGMNIKGQAQKFSFFLWPKIFLFLFNQFSLKEKLKTVANFYCYIFMIIRLSLRNFHLLVNRILKQLHLKEISNFYVIQ